MRAGIALGSNLGDRLANLRRAREELGKVPGVGEPILASRVYETEPVGTEEGANAFLNAVLEAEFNGPPAALLNALQGIEAALGRPSRHPRNSSRTIDLDILYCGDRVLRSEDIALPHPRLHLRRFVLAPLAEISPRLILPGQTKCVADLLVEVRDPARVEIFAEAWSRSGQGSP